MTKFIIALAVLVAAGGLFLYMQPAEAPNVEDTGAMSGDITMVHEEEKNPLQATDTVQDMVPTVVVEVSGVNFAFDKKEIRVKKGDIVKIDFVSESGFHDWVIDEFNARTAQVRDGGKTSITFVADKTGIFEYYCSVGKHRAQGMVGNLIVE